MRAKNLLLLPFLVLWWLAKLVALPAAVILLTWWLLPDSWLPAVATVSLVYLAVVLLLFRAVLRGKVRSLARGAVLVRQDGRLPGRSRRV